MANRFTASILLASCTILASLGPQASAAPPASTPQMRMDIQKGVVAYQHRDISAAQADLTQALKASQDAGIQNIDTAAINNYLGITYATLGEYSKAQQYLTEGLRQSKKFDGAGSISVATSEGFLAQMYLQQGQFVPAETEARRSLAIQNRQIFPDPGNKALTLKVLATALAGENKDNEAALYAGQMLRLANRPNDARSVQASVQSLKSQAQTYVTVTRQNAETAQINKAQQGHP